MCWNFPACLAPKQPLRHEVAFGYGMPVRLVDPRRWPMVLARVARWRRPARNAALSISVTLALAVLTGCAAAAVKLASDTAQPSDPVSARVGPLFFQGISNPH